MQGLEGSNMGFDIETPDAPPRPRVVRLASGGRVETHPLINGDAQLITFARIAHS